MPSFFSLLVKEAKGALENPTVKVLSEKAKEGADFVLQHASTMSKSAQHEAAALLQSDPAQLLIMQLQAEIRRLDKLTKHLGDLERLKDELKLLTNPELAQSISRTIQNEIQRLEKIKSTQASIQVIDSEIKRLTNKPSNQPLDPITIGQLEQNIPILKSIFNLCILTIQGASDSEKLEQTVLPHTALLSYHTCKQHLSFPDKLANQTMRFGNRLFNMDNGNTSAQNTQAKQGLHLVNESIELAKQLESQKISRVTEASALSQALSQPTEPSLTLK